MRGIFPAEHTHFFHVFGRALELALTLFYFILVYLEAKRVFHHFLPVFWARVQYSVGFALRDNVMPRRADVDRGEQIVDILEADLCAVQDVFIEPVGIY